MAKTEENKRVGRKIIESAKRGLTSGATRANTAGKAYLKTGATMGELLRAYGEAMAPIHQAEYTALTGEQLYPPKLQPVKWNNATQNYEAIDPNQPTISKAPNSYRAGTYEPKVGPQPIISAENVGELAYDPLNWISGGTTKAAATGAKLIGRGAKRLAPEIASMAEKYALPMQMHIVPPETGRAAFLKLKTAQLDPQKEIIEAIKAKDLQAHLDAGRSLATYLPSEGLHAEIKAALKPLVEKDIKTHPFIGYLSKDGKMENFNELQAKDADYHHSFLVNDIDAYDSDDALKFVRMGGENKYTIRGNAAITPHATEAKAQISALAQKLVNEGADLNAPFIIENMALPKTEAPYQNKSIGTLKDWLEGTHGFAQGGVVHMSKGGLGKSAVELAKKYITEPLSEAEFYKKFIAQHKDIRNKEAEARNAAKQAILTSGFNKGVNVNALPVDRGGPAMNIIDKRFGNKAGDRVYLLPKEGVLEGGNGLITAEGYVPNAMEVIDIAIDREPSYEAYLRNFTKKAEGGAVHMDEGGLNVSATGDYKTSDSKNMSGTKYNFSTDIDILNKYGFGVTKQGEIIKLPERSYTFDDGYTVTQPKHKIKRDNITELRARYATDDGIEYGVARQPMSKGWSGYRRNMKDNSSVGVNVSPYYTGVNYTKNFAEGGEVHPEFNFEQINQYAEGGVVAHNDFNYAEIDALAQGFAKGGPVLSVGRGEKLPVSQGAGLTAKGRAKYNRETGGNLKAPAPHPKSEKDANRRKSFCARMSGMPGPMKDENGNPTRKAASLKRWNC